MHSLGDKIDLIPRYFTLQWHITEKCNNRCRHCYQDNYTSEMNLEQMVSILEQYVKLLKFWKIPRGRAFLTITGGEPFLHPDFFKFLAEVYKYSSLYRWSILSNGLYLTRDKIKILKLFNLSSFQVSLEGLKRNNDLIRGPGSFKKITESIKLLVKDGVWTEVSFTANKNNYKDIKKLVIILANLGVGHFSFRRLIPFGQGSSLSGSELTGNELRQAIKSMQIIGQKLYKKKYPLTLGTGCEFSLFNQEIRPLKNSRFLNNKHHCLINQGNILAVLPDGSVLPCRRLPLVAGNIFQNSLLDIYYSQQILQLRQRQSLSPVCQNCASFPSCQGGARCLTYAKTGELNLPDPDCSPVIINKAKSYHNENT